MNRIFAFCLAALAGLVLAGCQSETQQMADAKSLQGDGPADVSERIARDLKDNNLLGALQAALPPQAFEKMKADYERERQQPPSEEDRAEFAAQMAKLTAADAESALAAELEPMLQKYETEMKAQMPLMLAMGRGFAQQWVQESKELNAEQKQQTGQFLDAAVKWLESVDFADRALARQAIAKLVATARALDLKTLDDLQALSFEEATAKGGIAFAGAKDILAVYGVKVDEALGSVRASVLREEGDGAAVNIEYRLFGQPLQVETEMVRHDGRWYGKDSLASLGLYGGGAAIAADDGHEHEHDFDEQEAETVED